MLKTIKNDLSSSIAIFFFLLFTAWFVYFHLPQVEVGAQSDLFTVTYGLIAAWGGIWGLIIAIKWGGFKSIMGKSLTFFALGLLSQEIGQIAYSYYIYYLHIELPYPSFGDYFFWATIPAYILGVFFLAQVSGVHISLRSFAGKLQAVVIPGLILLLCYSIFLNGYKYDWSDPIKILIDLGVPIGESIYLSLAILTLTLTHGTLGGVMRNRVLFILIALLAEFIADWTFLYQANRGTWSVSGIFPYMYFVAYFLMALALLQLGTTFKKLQDN